MIRARYHHESPPLRALRHPIVVANVVLLVINDHWLKQACPGWFSGKLSDAAFMVLAPLWLHAAWTLICGRSRAAVAERGRRGLWASAVLVLVSFVLMQTTAWGDWLFRYGLASLQWPFRALAALARGDEAHGLRPVAATPDVTDLVCLPLLAVPFWIQHRSLRPVPRQARSRWFLLALSAGLCGLFSVETPVLAQTGSPARSHRFFDAPAPAMPTPKVTEEQSGFCFQASPGLGLIWIKSQASVLSGFRQGIPSTAVATGHGLDLDIGGGHRRWLAFATLGFRAYPDPHTTLRGRTFRMQGVELGTVSIGAGATYYPLSGLNLHATLRVALFGLDLPSPSEFLHGYAVKLAAGHEWRLARHWWIGPGLAAQWARLDDPASARSEALSGELVVSLKWW